MVLHHECISKMMVKVAYILINLGPAAITAKTMPLKMKVLDHQTQEKYLRVVSFSHEFISFAGGRCRLGWTLGGGIVWIWGSDIRWQGVPTYAIASVPVAITVHSIIVLVGLTGLINWGLGVDAPMNSF